MRFLSTLFVSVALNSALHAAEPPSFLAPGAKLEKLWGDGTFTEGAVEGPDGAIYFSDIGNRVMRFDPDKRGTTVFREPSGKSNGLKFDAAGRLLACEGADGGGRRVSISEKGGAAKTLVDNWKGKKFNAPNDLTFDPDGRIYFTDPRYGGKEPLEIDVEAVYRVEKDGTATQVIADTKRPNGLVFAPDGKTLYVADNKAGPDGVQHLLAYAAKGDGTFGPKVVLHDFGTGRGIDGLTVATDGTIVATAGAKELAGVYFFAPDGTKLGFLPTPEDPTNVAFAGKDRKSLYLTAGKSLYRVETTLTGAVVVPSP